jgi:hypothetical protein
MSHRTFKKDTLVEAILQYIRTGGSSEALDNSTSELVNFYYIYNT